VAKTFEALMRAEKENKRRLEEIAAFEQRPLLKQPVRAKLTFPSQISEEYQRIKYNILNSKSGKQIKALLFTSPTKGEGNSTVIINFAMTLASEGDRVLLVDADLRNPSFHHVFNLERKKGLSELFLGKSTLLDVIKGTPFNNLFIITCGVAYSDPLSVFESHSLSSYIEEMKQHADWVLFDAPPINSSNDAITLGAKVDGVVMVVEAEKTRWEVAENAKQRIESAKGTVLGVVLNNRKFYIPEWLYKTL